MKNLSKTRALLFIVAALAVVWAIIQVGLSVYRKNDVVLIERTYAQFRDGILSDDRKKAYTCFTPRYRDNRPVEIFGEKFDFVRGEEYALHPNRSIRFTGNTAILIPWKGFDVVASGAGFVFEKHGTNWLLNGELEWFSD